MAQIFITGCSGIGKTTLAEYISHRHRIPFITGSTKGLWREFNVSSHKELLQMSINDPKRSLEFQTKLLEMRLEIIESNHDFVSDRSFIDNAVYFLYQNSAYLSKADTEAYLNLCSQYSEFVKKGKYIYLSNDMNDKKNFRLEDDGKRIDNPLFQDYTISPIFDKVIKTDLLGLNLDSKNFKLVKVWDWETRISIIDQFITEKEIINLPENKLTKWIKNLTKGNPCL